MNHITNMERFKVYEVKNIEGNVVYVGHTSRTLKRRLQEHTYKTLKHYENLTIHLVDSFDTKKEARSLEDQLQHDYGFVTDTEKRKLSASIGSIKKWSNLNSIERSLINKANANKAWESRDLETRATIIKKGHETRKILN